MSLLKEIWDASQYKAGDQFNSRSPDYDSGGDDAYDSWASEYGKQVDHYLAITPIHALLGIDAHDPEAINSVRVLTSLWEKYKKPVLKAIEQPIEADMGKYLDKIWERSTSRGGFNRGETEKPRLFFQGGDIDVNALEIIESEVYKALFTVLNSEKEDLGRLIKALSAVGHY